MILGCTDQIWFDVIWYEIWFGSLPPGEFSVGLFVSHRDFRCRWESLLMGFWWRNRSIGFRNKALNKFIFTHTHEEYSEGSSVNLQPSRKVSPRSKMNKIFHNVSTHRSIRSPPWTTTLWWWRAPSILLILTTILLGPVFPRWDLLRPTGPRWGAGQSTVPSSLWCVDTSMCTPPWEIPGTKVWFKDVLLILSHFHPQLRERNRMHSVLHTSNTPQRNSARDLLGQRPARPVGGNSESADNR